MKYVHLGSRLYGAALAIHPEKAAVLEAVFQARLAGRDETDDEKRGPTLEERARAERARLHAAYVGAGIALQRREDKPYALTQSGVALIPVLGTLVQRGGFMGAISGLASYDRIAGLVTRAADDPEVRGILLEIDSPGGEVRGLPDLANTLDALRQRKPLYAHANEEAYSAAYWLGSSAEHLAVAVSGGVGSIGTLAMLVDQTKRDSMMGYKYEFIYDGARKIDGNPHQALSDPARAAITAEVQRFGLMFRSHVAAMRGMSEEAVRATEAGLLNPDQALAGGFVDAIATLGETLAALEKSLTTAFTPGARTAARRNSTAKESRMETNDKSAAAQPAQPQAAATHSAADLAKASADARSAERARVAAITTCEQAKGRTKLAQHIAHATDMTLEQAQAMLGAAPVEAAAAGNALSAAMAGVKNPAVGADGEQQRDSHQPVIDAAAIFEARRQAASGK